MGLCADVHDTSMYNSLKLKTIPSILGNGRRLAQPCDEIHLEVEGTVVSERIQAHGHTYDAISIGRPEDVQLYVSGVPGGCRD